MYKKISIFLWFLCFGIALVTPKPTVSVCQNSEFAFLAMLEQRDVEYRKFLSVSVKIGVTHETAAHEIASGSGSGTIVYYDSATKLAYVASCGHLFDVGTMSAEEGKKKNLTCKITVWYHNQKKLDIPRTYTATVRFYSYVGGCDTSMLTFTPDWEPEYFPLGPADYNYKVGARAHSCGCDSGGEVAHYQVELLGLNLANLKTQVNSPRPGRSGGGLMDDSGYYIATCWGTQVIDGSGKGYFTPLHVIHRYWGEQKEYAFLLNQKLKATARDIPIIDRMGNRKYHSEIILLPIGR